MEIFFTKKTLDKISLLKKMFLCVLGAIYRGQRLYERKVVYANNDCEKSFYFLFLCVYLI